MKSFHTIVFFILFSGLVTAQMQTEDARRLAVVKQYTDGAKFVCDKTGDGSAKYLYSNVISLLHPLRMSRTFIEKIPRSGGFLNNMPIGILVLLQSDRQKKDLAPLFKQHLDPNTQIGGSFISTMGTIIIVENNDSSLVKGMTLLHEAGHAATFIEKKIPFPEIETEDLIEETKIHIFEEKLWRLIGGQVYENLIVKEVARLRANFKKEGFPGFKESKTRECSKGFSLESPPVYPELKTLVVLSTGESDMKSRQSALTESALFRIIEQDVPNNKDHQTDLTKASVIQYLYRLHRIYR